MERLKKLKEVKSMLSGVQESPEWSNILLLINQSDIEYYNWTDLEILIWYYENHKQE